MTEYEREVYVDYLKTIPKDVPVTYDSEGKPVDPKEKVFCIDGRGK